jgi:hypothetical protein
MNHPSAEQELRYCPVPPKEIATAPSINNCHHSHDVRPAFHGDALEHRKYSAAYVVEVEEAVRSLKDPVR